MQLGQELGYRSSINMAKEFKIYTLKKIGAMHNYVVTPRRGGGGAFFQNMTYDLSMIRASLNTQGIWTKVRSESHWRYYWP